MKIEVTRASARVVDLLNHQWIEECAQIVRENKDSVEAAAEPEDEVFFIISNECYQKTETNHSLTRKDDFDYQASCILKIIIHSYLVIGYQLYHSIYDKNLQSHSRRRSNVFRDARY